MRYSEIKLNDSVNGIGVNLSLWVQGCPIRCEGCHNEHIWDFEGGKPFGKKEIDYILSMIDSKTKRDLSILGGEPLAPQNIEGLLNFLIIFRRYCPDKKIFLWTGYKFETLSPLQRIILPYIDVVIDGRFEKENKQLQLKLRGSTNQRIIVVKETLESGEIVEMEG